MTTIVNDCNYKWFLLLVFIDRGKKTKNTLENSSLLLKKYNKFFYNTYVSLLYNIQYLFYVLLHHYFYHYTVPTVRPCFFVYFYSLHSFFIHGTEDYELRGRMMVETIYKTKCSNTETRAVCSYLSVVIQYYIPLLYYSNTIRM